MAAVAVAADMQAERDGSSAKRMQTLVEMPCWETHTYWVSQCQTACDGTHRHIDAGIDVPVRVGYVEVSKYGG